MINFRKFIALNLFLFSLSLSAMQNNLVSSLSSLTVVQVKSALLKLKSTAHQGLELSITNSAFDKTAYLLLLEILQQPGKITALHIGPECIVEGEWFSYEKEALMPSKKFSLRTFSLSGMKVASSLINEFRRSLCPFMQELHSLKITQFSDNSQEIQLFIEKFFSNKNSIEILEISENKISLAEISRILYMIMNKTSSLTQFISRDNYAEPSTDIQQKKNDMITISLCWLKTFPHHLANQLVLLDMSGMKISDKFAALIMGHFKNGHLAKLEHLNLSGIREEEPSETAQLLIDICAREKFYNLKSLQFNKPYVDKFNKFYAPEQQITKPEKQEIKATTQLVITAQEIDEKKMKIIQHFLSTMGNAHLLIDACIINSVNFEEIVSILDDLDLEILEFKNMADKNFTNLILELKNNGKYPNIEKIIIN